MSYTKIQTSTKDAKTKKAIELGTLATANAAKWKAIDGSILQVWQSQVQTANETLAGLDEVWKANRETLLKQFKGDRPKSQFAKYYSGYTGSVSNLNHFVTIARGKKDADGNYTGKLFTATDVKRFSEAIQKANDAGQQVKYSRIINLSTWFHAGATVEAVQKPSNETGASESGEQNKGKESGSARLSISVNGKGHLKETTEGELNRSLSKDGSMLDLCSDAFGVMFKAMERESADSFEQFKAQVVAKCGPLLVAELTE